LLFHQFIVTRGSTLAKIAYEISKSFDFIEIKMISSDFSDFKNDFRLQKSINCVGDLTKFIRLGAYLLEQFFIRRLKIEEVKYAIIYEILQNNIGLKMISDFSRLLIS